MRFSRIAIIFQSANLCGTALAAFKGYHIREDLKKFDCDGRVISEHDYRYQKHRASISIENNEHPHQTSGNFVNQYLENFSDTRWVLFLDESSRKFYLSDLDIPGEIVRADNGTQKTSYVLVLDNQCRTVAMFMKHTITQTDMPGGTMIATDYKICGIIRNYVE
ncbi:BgTH12-05184 [Blumeria graminis f. sp. triticale]|uniref:BgtE-20016 n=3 Tax=Blumeria graminis TaxID=34373 RepID=A0A381L0B8_BLUGR|nr:BgTH12-05184 [Blumeria graminis f. sp. triticale]VDB88010.1 BgtE-20016 [Blumeria graminis f. sp. tritici]